MRPLLRYCEIIFMIKKVKQGKSKLDLGDILSNSLQVFLILFLALMVFVILHKLRQPGFRIQAFEVPKHLVESGLNGKVFAMRIRDEIENMKLEVQSAKSDSTLLTADVNPDLDLEVLGVGFSTNNLLLHISDLFGIEQKTISGDLTDVDQELRLTIRGSGFPT